MWITGFIVCLGWIFSLCFHEFSHALVAYWGGDTSVKDKGYLTFNPIKYTEPGLSLIMPLVFILIGGIGLPGGAVYINDNLLRSRWWSSLVSAAGPCSSMLFALFLMMSFWVLNFTLEYELSNLNNYETDILFNIIFPSLGFLIYLEICSVIFNLLPIPPLDGYGIIRPWLSDRINKKLNKYSNYSYYFIFGLFLFVPEFSSFFFGIIKNICHLFNISYPAVSLGRQLFYQPINKFIAIIIILIVAYLLRLNENTWYKKGNSLARHKKDEQALVAYEKAIQIKPNYADTWLKKGHSLNRLQRYPEAVNSYQEVIKIDPNNNEAWLYLGHIYFNAKNYEQAINAYQKNIDLEPDNYNAWYYIASCYSLQKKSQEAIIALQQAISLNPQQAIESAKQDADFAFLQSDQSFQNLVNE